jgi:hypothetical protein
MICEICLQTEEQIKEDGGYLVTWGSENDSEKLVACQRCYNYGMINLHGMVSLLQRFRAIEAALNNPVQIARAVLNTPFEEIAPQLKSGIDRLMGKK